MMEDKWSILLINSKKSDPNFYICLQVRDALRRHADVEKVILVDYKNAVSVAQSQSFNLLFVYGGESINRPVIFALKSLCKNSVVWFTEDPYELSNNINQSDLFDTVFTNDPGSVSRYPCPAYFLPLAASQEFHFHQIPETDAGYRYDLNFIGTAWPNRTEFIKSLLQAKPELKYKLALPSNEFLPKVDLPVPRSEINWRTPNSELAKIANVSKFSLILHREFSASGNEARAESPGPRLFEIAMAGGVLLVDDSLEVNSELFTPGTEYLPFKNLKECISQIEYYQDKPDERRKLIKSAQQRAIECHTYDQRITALLQKIKPEKQSLQVAVNKQPQRSRLLIVLHNVINRHPFGGVEVYVDTVVKKLKQDYEIYFFLPNRLKDSQKNYTLLDADYKVKEEKSFEHPIDENWLTEPERERYFFELLVRYKIDIVHYHHLLGHLPSLPMISKVLGIKNLISIHDYYFICDSFNLLNEKKEYCDVRNRCIESCDICAFKRNGAAIGAMQKRRAFFQRVLNSANMVIGYSNTTESYHRSIFQGLTNFHVMPLPAPVGCEYSGVPKQTAKIKIAILGNFTLHKGAEQYLDIFRYMQNDDVEFHIYGKMEEVYFQILTSWNFDNVQVHQEYHVSELKDLLKDMNLSLHLSTWPETFLLTLSEAWMNGLIPIVSDIGALSERVIDGVNGFHVPVKDSGEVTRVIRRLISDQDLFNSVLNNVNSLRLTELDEHVQAMREIYGECHMSRIDEKTEPDDICLQSLSSGPVVNHLVKQHGTVTFIQPQVRSRFSQKLKKAYRYYRSNGVKRTCKRVLAELAKD